MFRLINRQAFVTASLVLSMLVPALNAFAQDCTGTLQKAEESFELGRFEEALGVLKRMEGAECPKEIYLLGLRLKALAFLATDQDSAAESSARQMLMVKPMYETDYRDPQNFTDLIEQQKALLAEGQIASVSKRAEPIEYAPATVVTLSAEEIRQRGYTELTQVIRDLSGFDMTYSFGPDYVNLYQRGFRSENNDKTLLMIDGVEENDLWTNRAYLSRQYPIENVKRVEIIYGPASTMYGQNAFAGVINVVTKGPSDLFQDGRNWSVKASGGYGSYNTRYFETAISTRKGPLYATFTGRIYQSDEMDLSDDTYFDFDPDEYDNVDYKQKLKVTNNVQKFIDTNKLAESSSLYTIHGASGSADSIVLTDEGAQRARALDKANYLNTVGGSKVGFSNQTESWFWSLKLSAGNFKAGIRTWKLSEGGITQFTDRFVAGSKNGMNWIPRSLVAYIKFDQPLGDNLVLSNTSFYKINTVDDNSNLISYSSYERGALSIADLANGVSPSWNEVSLFSNSKQFRNELKAIYSPSTKLDVVTGLEYRNSQLQGNYLVTTSKGDNPQQQGAFSGPQQGGNQFNINDLGVYAQGTYRFSATFRSTLGFRLDNNRIRANDGFGTELSPRVVLQYNPGDYVFKAIYSRGIMNVSNWLKYSTAGNRIPNGGLSVEEIQNFELSAQAKLGKELKAQAAAYYNVIDGVVGVRTFDDGTSQNDNIGAFVVTGLQWGLKWKKDGYTAYFSHTFTNPVQNKDATGTVDLRVGDIAGNQFRIGANARYFDRLNLNLRYIFVGERETGPGTTVELNPDKFPAYHLLSGAVTVERVLPNLDIQLIADNLLNTEYLHPGIKAADGNENPSRIMQRGFNAMLKLSYRL